MRIIIGFPFFMPKTINKVYQKIGDNIIDGFFILRKKNRPKNLRSLACLKITVPLHIHKFLSQTLDICWRFRQSYG